MAQTVRDIIKGAMRRNGALGSGNDPGAAEIADGLTAYNNLVRGFHGNIIGTPLFPVSLAASLTGEPGGHYMCALTAIATLTLPANPKMGARVAYSDMKANFATYNLTVNPNSRLIAGAASNLTISANSATAKYWFNNETGWVLEADATIDADCVYPAEAAGYLPDMLAVHFLSEFGGEVRPDVVARAVEGREVFARVFGRQGRNQANAPLTMTRPAA